MGTNQAWLAQIEEEIVEPDLPICDAHHHLWAKRDGVEPRYLLDELLRDTNTGHNIASTVYVEVRTMHRSDGPPHLRPIGEVEFVNGIAAMSASGQFGTTRVAHGIVAHADMTRGAAAGEVLDRMTAIAPGRFRGIRHVAAWDPDPEIRGHRKTPEGLMRNTDFQAGVRELGRRGLTFDAWCFHPQLSEMAALARAAPDTTVICNHVGGPLGFGAAYAGHRDEVFAAWAKAMIALARCPNVVVKLGGIFMANSGFGWHRREHPPSSDELAVAASPYVDHAITAFGADRCFFESNFPVEKISCSYSVLWNAFKKLTKDYTAEEKAGLFHDNAARIYRLAALPGASPT